jgi:hypothetical protein
MTERHVGPTSATHLFRFQRRAPTSRAPSGFIFLGAETLWTSTGGASLHGDSPKETGSKRPAPASWTFAELLRRASDTAVTFPLVSVLARTFSSGSVEPASEDVGVNQHLLHEPRCPPPTAPRLTPRGHLPTSTANRFHLPAGRRSSLWIPKHPRLGLPPVRCRNSSPSSDQAPPASFCSATRPASTPASPSPPPPLGGRAARSLRRAPSPTNGPPFRSRAVDDASAISNPTAPRGDHRTSSSPLASSRSRKAPSNLRTIEASSPEVRRPLVR